MGLGLLHTRRGSSPNWTPPHPQQDKNTSTQSSSLTPESSVPRLPLAAFQVLKLHPPHSASSSPPLIPCFVGPSIRTTHSLSRPTESESVEDGGQIQGSLAVEALLGGSPALSNPALSQESTGLPCGSVLSWQVLERVTLLQAFSSGHSQKLPDSDPLSSILCDFIPVRLQVLRRIPHTSYLL